MIETRPKNTPERALLIGLEKQGVSKWDLRDSMEELRELASSAGAEVVDTVTQAWGARSAWPTGIIVAGILLALISATLWFDRRYPLFPQFWRATLENGVGRIAFLALALGTLAIGGSL